MRYLTSLINVTHSKPYNMIILEQSGARSSPRWSVNCTCNICGHEHAHLSKDINTDECKNCVCHNPALALPILKQAWEKFEKWAEERDFFCDDDQGYW